METESKPKFYKRKWFWVNAGVGMLIFAIAFSIGSFRMSALLDGEMIKYDELVEVADSKEKEISGKENVIQELQIEIDGMIEEKEQLREQIKSNEQELADAKALIDTRDELKEEISKLESEKNTKNDEVAALLEQLSGKEKELALVSGKIIELKDKPKTLPAGFFKVGKDIPASRYKVTPNGNGNFFVNDGVKVNILLGKDDGFYESEYVFYAEEGDLIELTTSATFQPIQ